MCHSYMHCSGTVSCCDYHMAVARLSRVLDAEVLEFTQGTPQNPHNDPRNARGTPWGRSWGIPWRTPGSPLWNLPRPI